MMEFVLNILLNYITLGVAGVALFASGCVDLEEKEPLHEGKGLLGRFADHSRALLCLCHRYFYYSWIWTSCRESDSYCTIEKVPAIHCWLAG